MSGMDHGSMGGMAGMSHGGMNHGAGDGEGGMVAVKHPYPAENSPETTMPPDVVSTRLDDPGVGLRGNGRKVLTYADVHSMVEPPGNRPPTRENEMHPPGTKEKYK